LFSLVEEISGQQLVREYQPTRAVDVKNIVLDCSRIRKDFQWDAKIDLRDGLTRAWEWFCNHQEKR